MRRTVLVFVLLAAAAIALEPVVHTHPLTQSASTQCAVCVNVYARVTTLPASAISPLVILGDVATVVTSTTAKRPETPLASRAPPAA